MEVFKMTKNITLNIAFMVLTQAMTALIAEHMHFLFLILKKSAMNG